MELIDRYFPDLDVEKRNQLIALGPLYAEWNEKINVISRKDIDNLYLHHVLHSLAIVKSGQIKSGMKVIDIGTGGGFPGIPLAIMYPDVQFTLLDSTAKKIKVVSEIAASLKLKNVIPVQARAEEHKGEYDIVLSRAVSSLKQLVLWTKHLSRHWLCLKGGDQREMRKELLPIFKMNFMPVNDFFSEEYFLEKWMVEIVKS
ncbi:MAG: 16S rRNA (guanine(527)-N(7))-methyltransferase RsmG [Bacteroidota bacterium]|nr:16S rRNA (guanine(527)-N(7))-methyltransferase RsmG [Bacteroidota bacterium]